MTAYATVVTETGGDEARELWVHSPGAGRAEVVICDDEGTVSYGFVLDFAQVAALIHDLEREIRESRR